MDEISNAYAGALFSLSAESETTHETLKALQLIRQAVNNAPQYAELMASPAVSINVRLSLLESAFEGKVPSAVMGFLKSLCERGHIRLLLSCIDAYEKMYEAIHLQSTAYVKSAVSLTEDEKSKLIQKLEKKTGRRVQLVCTEDKSILGGLVVEMDGLILDGSLKTRLEEIKEVMKQ